MRESLHAALIGWARAGRRGQRLHRQPAAPVPAPGRPLVRGAEPAAQRRARASCSRERPQLQVPDACTTSTPLGADLDPALLGLHIEQRRRLTFEVIARRIDDRGGGLARVDGRLRLVEGLAHAARGGRVRACPTTTR